MRFNSDPTIADGPAACAVLEAQEDYRARTAALKLVRTKAFGPAHWVQFDLDEVMDSARVRAVLECLAAMAGAAFTEYAHRDDQWAEDLVVRELRAAEELAALVGDA